MERLNPYEIFRKALSGEITDRNKIETNIEYIVSVMESWLDLYEYHKEFEILVNNMKRDYLFNGTVYRGITLLNDNIDFKSKINYSNPQSFSKSKEIATDFAKNNMVTEKDLLLETKSNEEVLHVILELNAVNCGIDLDCFSRDLIYLIKEYISDKEKADDLEDFLNYAISEQEVILLPDMLNKNIDSIDIYTV